MEDMRLGGLFSISSDRITSLIVRIIGPILLVVLFLLISFMTYTYFAEILPFILPKIGVWNGMLVTSVGLAILFNVLFNYICCVYSGPGDLPESESLPKCRTCKGPKPMRAHHCSVCNKCVLKMDHHCPWIMNCVGHQNHRYFMLFLVYLTIGCLFVSLTSYSKFMHRPKTASSHLAFLLASVFFIVLLLFSAWHAFLILSGCTTIEIFGYYGNPEEKNKYNFSRGSWRKNLEVVFGTNSLLYALLPSRVPLPFDGVYWPDTLHAI